MSTALRSVEISLPATMAFFQIATASYYGYDAGSMTQIDWEQERQRLAARYAEMEDGELQKVAKDVRFFDCRGARDVTSGNVEERNSGHQRITNSRK
jgi:hypothetical protein